MGMGSVVVRALCTGAAKPDARLSSARVLFIVLVLGC
jgi:hypothetical protein